MRPMIGVPGETNLLAPPETKAAVNGTSADLSHPDLRASGLDPDGWVADASSFELPRPESPSVVVLGGMVPLIGDPAFTTDLRILVDGDEVLQKTCGVGRFELRVPVPNDRDQWRVELLFSAVQRLPEPDGRSVAAQVQ